MTRAVDRLTEENNCTEAVLAFEGWPPGLGVVAAAMLFAGVLLPWPLLVTLPVGAVAGAALLVTLARPMIVARAGETIVLVRVRLTSGPGGSIVAQVPRDGTISVSWPGGAGIHARSAARFRVAGRSLSTTAERERVEYILDAT